MIQKIEVEIAKETADVMDLLIVLVKDIKAKKPIGEISADALPKLIAAIDGAGQIAEEAADKVAMAKTIGLKLGELTAELI